MFTGGGAPLRPRPPPGGPPRGAPPLGGGAPRPRPRAPAAGGGRGGMLAGWSLGVAEVCQPTERKNEKVDETRNTYEY